VEFEGYQEPADFVPRFAFPLRDRFLQEGDGFKLLASIEGKPTPDVSHRKAEIAFTCSANHLLLQWSSLLLHFVHNRGYSDHNSFIHSENVYSASPSRSLLGGALGQTTAIKVSFKKLVEQRRVTIW